MLIITNLQPSTVMLRSFSSFHSTQATDDDELVSGVFVINHDDEEIDFRVKLQNSKIKAGGDIREQSTEKLRLGGMSPETFANLVELSIDFLESESNATFVEKFEEIGGKYTKSEPSGRIGDTTRREESEGFDSIEIGMGAYSISFRFNDSELRIPAASQIRRGSYQDFENVDLLHRVFFDFVDKRYPGDVPVDTESPADISESSVHSIEHIFKRFSLVVAQLQDRRGDKPPLLMQTEYDVQYLLDGLLRLEFDTVQRESNIEQHGEINPRIDFRIPSENICIETKRISETRPPKEIQKGISDAKEKNRTDANCETLLVFVYDPERLIPNPLQFGEHLSGEADNLTTRVIVTQ